MLFRGDSKASCTCRSATPFLEANPCNKLMPLDVGCQTESAVMKSVLPSQDSINLESRKL